MPSDTSLHPSFLVLIKSKQVSNNKINQRKGQNQKKKKGEAQKTHRDTEKNIFKHSGNPKKQNMRP